MAAGAVFITRGKRSGFESPRGAMSFKGKHSNTVVQIDIHNNHCLCDLCIERNKGVGSTSKKMNPLGVSSLEKNGRTEVKVRLQGCVKNDLCGGP
jgi:hypothetical protein